MLPPDWDHVAENDLFLSINYLRVLQDSAPKNMKCLFVGFFQNDVLIGIALAQMISVSNVKSFGINKISLKASFRDFVFKYASNRVLVIGNNMLTGQHGFKFRPQLAENSVIQLLHTAVNALRKYAQNQNLPINMTIIKDFETDASKVIASGFKNFYKFEIQPNMVFNIDAAWNTIDDYVAALSKKYRDQYKRATKKMEGIEKKKMSLQDISIFKERIYELYVNVTKNAPFNTFYLSENHFENMKFHLGNNFHFYGYFEKNIMIGFDTLIKNGHSMETYFLGYDDACQRSRMLYLNMLYNMIGFSIQKKFKEIVFARTALEIKSSVGAKPIPMYGFIQHSNPLLNKMLPKAFKYFEPQVHWNERNPFK